MEECAPRTGKALAQREIRARAARRRRGRRWRRVLEQLANLERADRGVRTRRRDGRRGGGRRDGSRESQRVVRLLVLFVKHFETANVTDAADPAVHVVLIVRRQKVHPLRRSDVEHVGEALLATFYCQPRVHLVFQI